MTDFDQSPQQPPQQPQQNPYPNPNQPEDKLSTILTVVSFCIPIVGAVLFFVNKDKAPQSAKTACYAALAGMVVGIILRVIMTFVSAGSSM